MTTVFETRCLCCEGTGRVAIIRTNDPFASVVPQLCNRPMSVTVRRARALLARYRRRDGRGIIVRAMADRLSTTPVPPLPRERGRVHPDVRDAQEVLTTRAPGRIPPDMFAFPEIRAPSDPVRGAVARRR